MKTMIAAALMTLSLTATAGTAIDRTTLGSGTPGEVGSDVGHSMGDNTFHAPQYMPNYPTAAPLWPRVVEVPCETNATGDVVCEGYNWSPAMGRGEYLFFKPVNKPAPVQTPPIVIYKEVPVKKGGE